MSKYEKFLAILMVAVVMFVMGLFIGERKVLNEQKVFSNESGYSVEFNGHEYLYNWGDSMTKKEQKKENNKRRNFWGMNPKTRVKNSKKKYDRNREKENFRKFSD